MVAAGLGTTVAALSQTFRTLRQVALVLPVNLVLVPLLGWGIAALLALATPAYVALILFASPPGALFGARLEILQWGDPAAGAAMRVVLALIGCVTFAITARFVLSVAKSLATFRCPSAAS